MFRRFLAAGLGLVLVSAAGVALPNVAQAQENWVLLKSKPVSPTGEKESIDLRDVKGAYRGIRIVAKGRGLEISNVDVAYDQGPTHSEKRSINLLAGERTRAINPTRADQFLDSVTIDYKRQPAGPAPIIEVYGLQQPSGRNAVRQTAAGPATGTKVQGPATKAERAPASTNARADDTNVVLFGSATVGFGVDRDVIKVGKEIGQFDRIRLRVLDNDIFLRSLRVVYADGQSDEVAIDADIKKNTLTKWLNLKGDRFISEIIMNYRSRPNVSGRAFVEVYGDYAEGWLGPNGRGKNFNAGWVLLGAQTAGYSIDRNDVVRVGRNEGGFRRVRINVRDEKVTLFEVRVIYGNGEVDVIPANRTVVNPGGSYGPIDLKGGSRVITEIRPTYRTQVGAQALRAATGGGNLRRATVEFWGLH